MELDQWFSVELSDERKKRSENTDVKWSEKVYERQMVDMRTILLCEEERKAKGVLSKSQFRIERKESPELQRK